MSRAAPEANALLRKADEDLYVAASLGKDPAVSMWPVGFHAQQAVEKALKSVLMHQGIRYPFTHDVEALVTIVKNSALPLPPDADILSCLTPFAALFRYEDEEFGSFAAVGVGRMVGFAETTVTWARSILAEDDTQGKET